MATVKELESEDIVDSLDSIRLSDGYSKDGSFKQTSDESFSAHCCICQESYVNPVQLPCEHIFCYLCIKGVAARNNKCALCRKNIPKGFLDSPSLLNTTDIKKHLDQCSDTPVWLYQGKHEGWWMYEQRTSSEVEKAYKEEKETFRFQISGFFYIIDFAKMLQYREDVPNRRRAVRRDTSLSGTDVVKGIAGVYLKNPQQS